jgi:hypothetical protein
MTTRKSIISETKQSNRYKRLVGPSKKPHRRAERLSSVSLLVPKSYRDRFEPYIQGLKNLVYDTSCKHAATNLGWFGDSKGQKLVMAPKEVLMANPEISGIVKTLRSFFPPGRILPFRMTANQIALGTTGAGALLMNISFDPNITSFNEWSTISLLFDEVRVIAAEVNLTSCLTSTSTLICNPWFIGPQQDFINTNPPNVDAVYRLSGVKVFSPVCTTGKPAVMVRLHLPSSRPFCTTSAPSESTPPSGCAGGFWVCSSAASTAATQYYLAQLDCIYEFRMRA